MLDRGLISRLRSQRDLAAYQQRLVSAIGRAPALRILPGLLHLPLPIADAAGALTPLRRALSETAFLTLAGPPGSGRRLAMQQLALYYARSKAAADMVPALIDLTTLDDGRSLPELLLDNHLHALYRPAAPRQAARNGASGHRGGWLLLINGWELLTPDRRYVWRAALQAMAARQANVRALVALPREEPAWPGFRPLAITAPSQALVARWLQHLCPASPHAAALAALAPDGPLAGCAERLFEIALFAWLVARGSAPASRADLYARALEALPAEIERVQAELHIPLGHPQIGRFAQAQRLAAEGTYASLAELPAPDRGETALLAVGLAQQPEPVLAALWRARLQGDDVVLALGRCLKERPAHSPVWPLRVATALATVARERGEPLRQQALHLLHACLPELDRSLAQVAQAKRPARRFITRLLRALPPELALPRTRALALGETTCEPLAWAAADLLRELAGPASDSPTPPEGAGPLARWAYVSLLASSETRATVDHAALRALAASGAGGHRLAQAGSALLGDTTLPAEQRVGGLELLLRCSSEKAWDAVRLACEDPSPLVRRAALDALARIDPDGAQAAMQGTAENTAAPWAARLDAMLRLGASGGEQTRAVLARYARDTDLPLIARLRVVAELGRHSDPDGLLPIVRDDQCSASVRAVAARALAASQQADLGELLGVTRATPALRAAVCAGLRERGQAAPGDEEKLLGVLEEALAELDFEGASAAAGALGRIGGSASVAALSRLLQPEATDRLLASVPAALLQQTPETCLDDPHLPAVLYLPLATALARGLTPADRPTTLREFLVAEIDQLRAAAAQALGMLGGEESLAALRAVLREPASATTAAAVAALSAIGGVAALGDALGMAGISQAASWQVVQYLAAQVDAEPVLREALARPDLDPFTQGALAEALGARGASSALPLLSQLARDPLADPHVQAQAVAALGRLAEPAAEVVLLRIATDASYTDELRGLAAASLPRTLSHESRRVLREALRVERVPAPIIAGALSALGRAGDRESLPLALRYCLDERPDVVRAAITALADIGEETVTPVLARAAQDVNSAHVTRIQASGALLRLGGSEHRLLLKPYLEHGSPLLQLRALDELIAAGAGPSEVAALLLDRSRALPLRLRALEHLASVGAAADALTAIVDAASDEPQLRCRAAQALGAQRETRALAVLAGQASSTDAALDLRYRCIEALGTIGGAAALETLSHVAERGKADQLAAAWAARALEQAVSEARR